MFLKIVKNFLLYSFSFLISLYLHKGTILPGADYALYYAAYMFSWGISGLLVRKYKTPKEFWLLNKLYNYAVSFFLMLGILAFIIYRYDLTGVSRFVILNSLIMSIIIEMGYLLYKNKGKINFRHINLIYSSKAFTFEVIIFGVINLYLINQLNGNISFNSSNLLLFLNFYLSWFVGSYFGHQFHPRHRTKNYWAFIWQYMKAYIIILALALFGAFVNGLSLPEMQIISYGIISYSIISFAGISLYYHIKKHRLLAFNYSGFSMESASGDVMLDDEFAQICNHTRSLFDTGDSDVLELTLKNLLLNSYPGVFEFLDDCIDLYSFDNSYSVIIKSENISNIDFLRNDSIQFLLNLQQFNKIHSLSEYLSEVNNKLMGGGLFAGNFKTTFLKHRDFLKLYPYYLGQIFYFFDFLFNRVFPKISILKGLYHSLSGGRYRDLTLAEGLGVLNFYGFDILNLKIIDNTMFFISKKKGEPMPVAPPPSGLLYKMKRVGKNGKFIEIYKLRTMHPYSEYIQDFTYNLFGSTNGDKISNDFRVAFWGKAFRKIWLDEMPMLINLVKGEIKLVGVRPLSLSKLRLYPPELQELRLSVKPGLIPPFYADLPKSFEGLLESEKKYIQSYKNNPIKTDLKYLIQCVYNILFKGARSS